MEMFTFLKNHLKKNYEISKIKRTLKYLQPFTYFKQNFTIVFNPGNAYDFTHIDFFLAFIYAQCGAKTYILLDDGIMEHWDSTQVHWDPNCEHLTPYKQSTFKLKKYLYKKDILLSAYKHKNIKVIYYSTILKKSNLDTHLEDTYKDDARSSVLKFFETGEFDENNIKQNEYYLLSIKNCKISKKIGEYIVNELKPDLFITVEGKYSNWSPCYKVIKKSKIKAYSYLFHPQRPGKIFFTDVFLTILQYDSYWEKFKNYSLNDEKIDMVRNYFIDRETKKDSLDLKAMYSSDLDWTKFSIKIEDNKKVFGLFPNVVWDGSEKERDTIFNGMIDWILFTINGFKTSQHQLIIRFHPSEATLLKGGIPLESIILDRIKNISDFPNVTLILSHQKVDTYSLIDEYIDIGLIYDSTLVLEMLNKRIPVIACAKGRCALKEFTYHPNSRTEYLNWICNPHIINNYFASDMNKMIENAYKYAYWLFFENAYDIPILEHQHPISINYDLLNRDNINLNEGRCLEKTYKRLQELLLS